MRHQEVFIRMALYGEVFHCYFLATTVKEVHGELGGDTHHVESLFDNSFFRNIYLVHGGHRDGISVRIVRSEVEFVHFDIKITISYFITVEESG